jgi:iron complex transport system ATP-binding protein
MTSAADLVADHVSFGYSTAAPVIHDVSCSIAHGTIVGILGPNGSGKTTLLRLLAGLIRPWSGSVTLGGRDVRDLGRASLATRIAVVPQETQLAFDYTALEIATMGRYPHLKGFDVEGPEDLAIARQGLRATGTAELESRMFNTLSGGEKQRVVIASALAQAPEVLLLDEPTASLDLAYQLEVRSILQKLNTDNGLTVVISTHDVNLAAGLCDHLIMLSRGRLLAAGTVAQTLNAATIRALYDVEVEITPHPRTGVPTIIPLSRA